MADFRDPIFRGCTRPATFAGVPLIPFLTVSGSALIVAGWTCYLVSASVGLLVAVAYVPVLQTMRTVTKKDDQRVRQLFMRARMRVRQRRSIRQWSAVTYSPLRFVMKEPV